MKPPLIGALAGALFAFLGFIAPKVLPIYSIGLQTLLFPGGVLLRRANGFGTFGHMMVDTFAYLGSLVLYAAAGLGIGWLVTSRRSEA